MAADSVVYERPIDRLPSAKVRARIEDLIEECRSEVPFPFEHQWDKRGKTLQIHSSIASWRVKFLRGRVVVTSELSLVARLFDTRPNRARMSAFFDQVVEELAM